MPSKRCPNLPGLKVARRSIHRAVSAVLVTVYLMCVAPSRECSPFDSISNTSTSNLATCVPLDSREIAFDPESSFPDDRCLCRFLFPASRSTRINYALAVSAPRVSKGSLGAEQLPLLADASRDVCACNVCVCVCVECVSSSVVSRAYRLPGYSEKRWRGEERNQDQRV